LLSTGTFTEAPAPLNGRSLQYLQAANKDNPFDPFDNYDMHDRMLALTELKSQNNQLTNEANERLSAIINENAKRVEKLFTIEKTLADDTANNKIQINYLVDFLKNPAEARLKRQLRLTDMGIDDAAEQESEPFTSVFPTNLVLTTNAQERYIKKIIKDSNIPAPAEFFKKTYNDAHQQSITPDGVFARLDAEKLGKDFTDSVAITSELMTELSNFSCNTISIGMPGNGENTISFPAFEINAIPHPATIHGSQPFVWKTDQAIEMLVLTSSSSSGDLKPGRDGYWRISKHILPALLTYIVLQSGNTKNSDGISSAEWIANLPLKINICYKAKEIVTATFAIDKDTAIKYLVMLSKEYLTMNSFEDLPLDVICKKALWPLDATMKADYFNNLEDEIENSLNDSFGGGLSRMALLNLISDLTPPCDAFDKVTNRLLPILHWRVI
jgi:hypothetical protein